MLYFIEGEGTYQSGLNVAFSPNEWLWMNVIMNTTKDIPNECTYDCIIGHEVC